MEGGHPLTDTPSTRFAYFEIVVVLSTPTTIADGIAGKTGTVLGISIPDTAGESVSYALSGHDFEETWVVADGELESTGQFDRREDFYTGESIRVSEDGESLGN